MQPMRYAGGRRRDGFKPIDEVDGFELAHIAGGRNPIRFDDDAPDLEDEPERWQELWNYYGDELTARHVKRQPGTRPRAWWQFTHDQTQEPLEGETQADMLDRLGLIDDDELEAIRKEALELVIYNLCGRRPEKPSTNVIPPSGLHGSAARRGLLSDAERAVLLLDSEGVYRYRNSTPKWEV